MTIYFIVGVSVLVAAAVVWAVIAILSSFRRTAKFDKKYQNRPKGKPMDINEVLEEALAAEKGLPDRYMKNKAREIVGKAAEEMKQKRRLQYGRSG